jgi:hypothetical protein
MEYGMRRLSQNAFSQFVTALAAVALALSTSVANAQADTSKPRAQGNTGGSMMMGQGASRAITSR